MRISDWSSDVCSSDLLDTTATNLNRTKRDCSTAASKRRFLVHIYFLANNDKPGDGIHTLKRAELGAAGRSEEHTSELQSLMRISYAVFCLKKKTHTSSLHTYSILYNLTISIYCR